MLQSVKSSEVIINLAKRFHDAANWFVPAMSTLLQKEKDLLCEPDDRATVFYSYNLESLQISQIKYIGWFDEARLLFSVKCFAQK